MSDEQSILNPEGGGGQRDWFAEALQDVKAVKNTNEKSVEENLVKPVLYKELGFHERREIRGNEDRGAGRPDYVCLEEGQVHPFVIVESKELGVPLLPGERGGDFASSPAGQLQQYLNGTPEATEGTWGVCTSGTEWISVRRGKAPIGPGPFYENHQKGVRTLAGVRAALSGILDAKAGNRRPIPPKGDAAPPDTTWPDRIADAQDPETLIRSCLTQVASQPSIEKKSVAGGIAGYAVVGKRDPASATLPVKESTYFICTELELPGDIHHPSQIISRKRVADLVSETWKASPSGGVGVVYGDDKHGQRWCTGFAWDENKLFLTALVRPHLPGTRTAQQFAALESCANGGPLEKALDKLAETTEKLHKGFYDEIAKWFKRGRKERTDLEHLIRVLFAWLLQDHRILPGGALWHPGKALHGDHDIHDHLLWLFADVLAVPIAQRKTVTNDPWRESLLEKVPYLNGSLFNRMEQGDQPEALENDRYWDEDSGLLSLLAKYQWTLSDRTGYASESALDPSMLGAVFERLIVVTDGVHHVVRKGQSDQMPDGAYYTPQDIADEMASDAIAGWLHSRIPDVPWANAKVLVHPVQNGKPWEKWKKEVRAEAGGALKRMTVLDPCCGSGTFTIAMLHALRRGQERLWPADRPSADIIETIIEKQLHAADIHPLAVLITRLRLFIAWIENWSLARDLSNSEINPMPNLETKCRTVNTLCVNLSSNRWIFGPDSKEAHDAFGKLRAATEALTIAHGDEDKKEVLKEYDVAREELRDVLSEQDSNTDTTWLDEDVFATPDRGAEADLQVLFPAPDFPDTSNSGWDIVIGNPPYQSPNPEEKSRQLGKYGDKGLGYLGAGTDLYLMFIEAALHVAKLNGCISLIVPNSIVFKRRRSYREVRHLLERKATRIDIRTYDNRPHPMFPPPNWLRQEGETDENRQRVTVLYVLKGKRGRPSDKSQSVVHSAGFIRLKSKSRAAILRQTIKGFPQSPYSDQWTQAPTESLAKLLCVMYGEKRKLRGKQGPTVSFPNAPYQFITCLPEDTIKSTTRKLYDLPDNLLYPGIGLYNSHLFHAYWLMIGDGLNMNGETFASVRKPVRWDKDIALQEQTGRVVRELMDERNLAKCRKVHTGKEESQWPNYDFHSGASELIEDLDKLLLKAYELDEEPLLRQMRIIRTGSAHQLFLPGEQKGF